uniref:Uncharacterized protein n=1 Tax=Pseudictyota dubia TaxID=2749911 RepID=A0A7R9WME0_9STRA|mmetsp:Transcript_9709/g.18390  ORF Transcript_9709/g.18390 Transcript_9709/m.18390 type:complete len:465 (+) Transcript_9709:572-1966(+)
MIRAAAFAGLAFLASALGFIPTACSFLIGQGSLLGEVSPGWRWSAGRASWHGPAGGKKTGLTSLFMSDGGVGDGSAELVGALARLDRKWELQRKANPYGDWQKLVVGELSPKDPASSPSLEDFFGSVAMDGKPTEQFVYLLEPEPPTTPSCVLLFLGGAGLGQYPHIAYSELLKRVARRLNAAVICAPYQLGTNHFDIAKDSCEALQRAIILLEDERGYRPSLPKFLLAHSLGGKLGTISIAATGIGDEFQGIGFMSWNNYGMKDIVRQSRSFAKELGIAESFGSTPEGSEPMLDGILDFAEMAMGMVGIEFSPSPDDTERMMSMKYDEELQGKTRLFVFDEDDLDSSKSFVNVCQQAGGSGPTVSSLPGSHLTPVYLKFGVDELDLPEEARDIADEFTGGFQGASFGDENNLNAAVNEICGWVLGKPPSKEMSWGKAEDENQEDIWTGPRRLSGGVIDAEVES